MDLSIQLAPKHPKGLLLSNPVMTASGTFGYGTESNHILDIQKLGAIVSKGTTLEPRDGNYQPRIVETPYGVLNSVGLQNIGVKALINDKAPIWAGWRVPVIVNIAGETIDEYAEVASALEGVDGISAIEVNISCPNIKAGGIEFGNDPNLAARVITAVKAATSRPVLAKLTPNTGDIVEVAQAVSRAGADAITLINTFKAMAIDIDRRKPILGNLVGGLSGPAVKPMALFMVYQTARAVAVPVIGCGGIMTANDAIEFILAGASAVQVGTANFSNPRAPLEILQGIEKFIAKEGLDNLSDLIGAAQVPK